MVIYHTDTVETALKEGPGTSAAAAAGKGAAEASAGRMMERLQAGQELPVPTTYVTPAAVA